MKKDEKDAGNGGFGIVVFLVLLILALVSILGYGYFLVKGNEVVEKPKERVFSNMEILDAPITEPPEQNPTPEANTAIDMDAEGVLSVDYPEEPAVQDAPTVASQYDNVF